MEEGMKGEKCYCPHHKVVPIFVVLLGLLFLLNAFNVFNPMFVSVAWPILVIAAGLTKMFEHKCTCCRRM